MEVTDRLKELAEHEYADFQSKLVPGIARESILGIRVPILRGFAKEIIKEGLEQEFIENLPHQYYDENILHSIILSQNKDFDTCLALVEDFLPYIDNWAVCDILSPKVFGKHKEKVLPKIRLWIASKEVYTCRFGVGMLMSFFLDEDFSPELLELPAAVISEEYYINMMLAWFYATALAKQWDESIIYLEKHKLTEWVHQKTIQKGRESYRISAEQKEYLKSLKRT